ncbi:hypothetical protein HK101_008136 [Irineochytrium annulatum]|nr:hypothetical protein HK101_008136 [Irineochytrium annulatum]
MAKDLDVVVYGATGFTGKRVAKEIVRHLSSRPLKWGVAGRDRKKLEEVISFLELEEVHTPPPEILVADVSDDAALEHVLGRAVVCVNCVGPFRFFGEPVVKACVSTGTHYVDITGEPEFVEKIFLKYHKEAQDKGISIVPCCGFDSIPADLGNLFTKQEFNRRGYTAAQVEMYINIITGKHGSCGNFATYESAVYGIANADELRKVRKLTKREKVVTIGPKMKILNSPRFDKFAYKWVLPFIGADASVVRMGQQLSESLRLAGYKRPVLSLQPVQFAAYLGVQSRLSLVGMIIFGGFLTFLSRFSLGRYLLLKYPGFFSFGQFSRKGPSHDQMKETSFTSTFRGKGYKRLIASGQTDPVVKPVEYEIVTKVAGPEPGYVATPIAVVAAALMILDDQSKTERAVFAGVLTPASAFGATDLIKKLDAAGIKFSVVSERDL